MVDKVTFTVVTIALNDLAGIQQTFKSLADQTHRNVQHIIVDGGSTDGTAEWAVGHPVFADTVVASEPDRGIYEAMNKGLKQATGDLVAFLNSGDQYADATVLEMVARSYSREHWRWAYGFGRMVTESGATSAGGRTRKRHSWLRNTFWSYEICHPAVFMEPDFARRLGGFDESLQIAADYKMTTAAGRKAQPRVFPRVMAVYLEGGVSDTQAGRSLFETHQVRVELLGMGRRLELLDKCWTLVILARSKSRRRAGRLVRRLSATIKGAGGGG